MPQKSDILIGQLLVQEGVITPDQLEEGLRAQKEGGGFLCTTIVKLGFASEDKVFSILSRQLRIPYVHPKDRDIPPDVIQKVSAKFASHYKIIPLEIRGPTLIVAMADPLDVRTLDDLRLLLDIEVKGVLASEWEIREVINKYYGLGAETLEKMASLEPLQAPEETGLRDVQDLEALAEDASIIKFVNQVFSEAVRERATDIHMEPFQDELRVRFRIDGMLYHTPAPESITRFHAAIVSRIKIMAHLDIAERRLPQDGRIKIKINKSELDMRVSTLPSAFGEAIHIRVLSSHFFLELDKLGLAKPDRLILESIIKRPHGVVFVTGPTGSGKTTTLYASLARVNEESVKVITIEDPIEYQLRGVIQMQVGPKIGLDFAAGLRHILRHDPDVIMVGEVRDYETAEIAIRSALTGHLVFSTLHTNDAAGAVTRLLDMGIEPFLVASSLECLIAQRLVRLLCPACKIRVKARPDILEPLEAGEHRALPTTIYEPKGCEACRFTGYRGRTAIYEILVVSEPIRDLILAKASSQQIKQKALTLGMRTLRQDGLAKVGAGLTSTAEVIRVTQQEEIPEE